MPEKLEIDNYINKIIDTISEKDPLHAKKIKLNINDLRASYSSEFYDLTELIRRYFEGINLDTTRVVNDYLRMISDMRVEGLYFYKHGKYRCQNQLDAYENVYSKSDVMSYYMNALLLSQILWKHHFKIFIFFQKRLINTLKIKNNVRILDIGPGHGFFSYIVKKEFPEYRNIDIVDISETSLMMTKRIIGEDNGKIRYLRKDIFDFDDTEDYDIIIIGEVIEHLDDPKAILRKLGRLLNFGGRLWLTTPTNAPAIDHVYLFKSRQEVFEILNDTGLEKDTWCNFFAEEVDEEAAIKNKVTDLVGVFCKKNEL